MSSRGRMRTGRVFPQRARQTREENDVQIDLEAPLDKNINEILKNAVQCTANSRGFLRGLVKLGPDILQSHLLQDGRLGYWSILDIYRCIRLLLVDEDTEVKAEALRCLRHLTDSESTFDALCQALIPSLVVKSLDIVLDNKVERLQALRLMRRCAAVAPLKFPIEFVHSILSVANDGAQERDNFVKACVGTAAELCIANPRLWLSCGAFMTIVRSVLSTCGEPRVAESLVITLMFIINDPETRYLANANMVLEYLIAPFTDKHFQVNAEDSMDNQEREKIVTAARQALCSVLRSWPGLIYFCSDQSGLTKLIELLRVPDTETQRSIMGLFFDLFCLQTPEWTTDFRIALLATDDKTGLQRGWLLYEGFVASEGCDILPSISKSVNLASSYMGILLLSMVSHGLIDAVAVAAISDDTQVSIHATVLLAELLHLCNRFFPFDAGHVCHLLPRLVDATISADMNIRLKAISVIYRLAYIEQFKFQTVGIPTSLYLEQQFMFCDQVRNGTSLLTRSESMSSTKGDVHAKRKAKPQRKNTNPNQPNIDNMITNSGVITNDNQQYDWDIVKCVLGQAEFSESPHSLRFIERLINFYMPSSRLFSAIELEREQAKNMCSTLLALADFLLEKQPSTKYLSDLLNDTCNCLQQIEGENIPPNSVLSPSKVSSTLSQAYFLLIGRLTGSPQGLHLLKKATIFDQLMKVLTGNPHNSNSMNYNDIYIKLALSPLNYTCAGPTRELFKHVIISNRNDSARLYCVNLLKMLLRSKLSDLSRWAIELLVGCLIDKGAVRLTAYEVLNEACDVVDNLDSLIALNPDLNHDVDDHAWMLNVRYFSRLDGIAILENKGTFDAEINRWLTLGSLKYVKWVEDTINQSVSRHRRNADGQYGRRSSDHKLHRLRAAFCPPHLLGQLASHEKGIDIIRTRNLVTPVCDTIRNAHMDSPTCVFYVKAALWSVGHVCKSKHGLKLVQDENIIAKIVELAKSADVFGVRGAAFYSLCLISVTNEGCDILSSLGWEGVRQCIPSPELYASRRTESVDSSWSLDSSWASVQELRERTASARDSFSFDEVSNASDDNLSLNMMGGASNTYSFTDMRKLLHSYTSQVDAVGYGTLKMLRPKRRYRSTGEQHLFDPQLQLTEDSVMSVPTVLIGLVLPRQICSIFNRDYKDPERADMRAASITEPFGSRHVKARCLKCGDRQAETGECDFKATEVKDGAANSNKVTEQERMQARNDILRYVCNLAAVYPNHNKQVEQWLLSMKQKQPWVFSDLCLYSDLCHLMRIFMLKQPFRKFLQELFLDVDFSELRTRAEDVVRSATTLTINATSETINEDEEEELKDAHRHVVESEVVEKEVTGATGGEDVGEDIDEGIHDTPDQKDNGFADARRKSIKGRKGFRKEAIGNTIDRKRGRVEERIVN